MTGIVSISKLFNTHPLCTTMFLNKGNPGMSQTKASSVHGRCLVLLFVHVGRVLRSHRASVLGEGAKSRRSGYWVHELQGLGGKKGLDRPDGQMEDGLSGSLRLYSIELFIFVFLMYKRCFFLLKTCVQCNYIYTVFICRYMLYNVT